MEEPNMRKRSLKNRFLVFHFPKFVIKIIKAYLGRIQIKASHTIYFKGELFLLFSNTNSYEMKNVRVVNINVM